VGSCLCWVRASDQRPARPAPCTLARLPAARQTRRATTRCPLR
jgi:hypothetical protein